MYALKESKHAVCSLSKDLSAAFPDMQGFSTNLRYMRRYAEECSARPIDQQPADQLSWFYIVVLITRLSKETPRERYSSLPTIEQIETELQSDLDRDREGKT